MSKATSVAEWLGRGVMAAGVGLALLCLAGWAQQGNAQGQMRYLTTASTQASFTLNDSATSFKAVKRYAAGTYSPAASATSYRFFDCGRSRSIKIGFMGVGADNSTFTYRVFLVNQGVTSGSVSSQVLSYAGGGTVTLGTSVGVSDSDVVLTTEREADTVTWTVAGAASATKGTLSDLETLYAEGGSGVSSPADNGAAVLCIPFLGRAEGVLVEFALGTATQANCWIEPSLP